MLKRGRCRTGEALERASMASVGEAVNLGAADQEYPNFDDEFLGGAHHRRRVAVGVDRLSRVPPFDNSGSQRTRELPSTAALHSAMSTTEDTSATRCRSHRHWLDEDRFQLININLFLVFC